MMIQLNYIEGEYDIFQNYFYNKMKFYVINSIPILIPISSIIQIQYCTNDYEF